MNTNLTTRESKQAFANESQPSGGILGWARRCGQAARLAFSAMVQTAGIHAEYGVLLMIFACPVFCNAAMPVRTYQNTITNTLRLGGDLSQSLPAKFGDQIDHQVIAYQTQDSAVVTPIVTIVDTSVQRQVALSAGFIDLLNHICHAKAVDRIEPGFFDQYVKSLPANVGDGVTALPKIRNPRYWTDDVIKDQMSYFNQMVGFVMAINMSHHYLGHYAKYSSRMGGAGDKFMPINNFLTPSEWELSVKAAALDSLNCALATDGSRALFEAIDKMPHRPAWASYIVPSGVDIKKLNEQLARYEDDFFGGRLESPNYHRIRHKDAGPVFLSLATPGVSQRSRAQ